MLLCELYGRFQTFRSSLFSATSIILSDGEERDQRGEPYYSERQYDFIRKHLTKGSLVRAETRDFHSRRGIGEERSLGEDLTIVKLAASHLPARR